MNFYKRCINVVYNILSGYLYVYYDDGTMDTILLNDPLKDAEQDARLNANDLKNATQDGRLTVLERWKTTTDIHQTEQDTRIFVLEGNMAGIDMGLLGSYISTISATVATTTSMSIRI